MKKSYNHILSPNRYRHIKPVHIYVGMNEEKYKKEFHFPATYLSKLTETLYFLFSSLE